MNHLGEVDAVASSITTFVWLRFSGPDALAWKGPEADVLLNFPVDAGVTLSETRKSMMTDNSPGLTDPG